MLQDVLAESEEGNQYLKERLIEAEDTLKVYLVETRTLRQVDKYLEKYKEWMK